MQPQLNEKYLITTDGWFFAPDGEQYRAVWGTVTGIHSDEEALGIKTNRGSTNWYVQIGNMIVAGCQIHYCIQSDSVSFTPIDREVEHEGGLNLCRNKKTNIYNADS